MRTFILLLTILQLTYSEVTDVTFKAHSSYGLAVVATVTGSGSITL